MANEETDTLRVLVTGARGYLGGRLIQWLERKQIQVIGTSRNAMQPPPEWPRSAKFVVMDPLGPTSQLTDALGGVNVVIHLASANERRSQAEPDLALQETGAGTRRLLAACMAAGVKRFIFLSTIHVYGAPLLGSLCELSLPKPMHPYAITHQVGEAFTLAAGREGAMKGIVVRLSNGIGAPAWPTVDRWTLVGNDLARQAVEHGTISVQTPGQWRDFIPLSDVCAGLFTLVSHPGAATGIYNLASGVALQVDDIARRTATLGAVMCGRQIEIKRPETYEIDSLPAFNIVIDRLRALGFVPSSSNTIDAEIQRTLRLVWSAMSNADVIATSRSK